MQGDVSGTCLPSKSLLFSQAGQSLRTRGSTICPWVFVFKEGYQLGGLLEVNRAQAKAQILPSPHHPSMVPQTSHTCCWLLGVYGSIVDTWNMISWSWYVV